MKKNEKEGNLSKTWKIIFQTDFYWFKKGYICLKTEKKTKKEEIRLKKMMIRFFHLFLIYSKKGEIS